MGTGVWMQTLVFAWLAYSLTGSTFLLALFTAARMSPMCLGPIGGLLADRMDRKRLLAIVQITMFLVSVTIALLVMNESIRYWHLLVAGFLLGLGGAPTQPARISLITDVVKKEHIANGIVMSTISFNITQVLGPAFGGLVYGWFGPAFALWIAAVWYVAATVSILVVKGLPERAGRMIESPLRELWEGFHILLANRLMLASLSVTLAANAFGFAAFQTFMPVFAKDILHTGPDGLGFLQMASGIGAIAGTIALASVRDIRNKGTVFILGTGAMGALLAAFSLSTAFPNSMVILGLFGLTSAGFGVMQSTIMMILAPPEFRGRAMGVHVLFIGILPIGVLIQGIVASAIGVAPTTTIAGALLCISMLILFLFSPKFRRLS